MNKQRSGTQIIVPFLNWAGGKRWFVCNHADLLPSKYDRYVEPFLGGGSVFFYLQPKRSILGDVNVDLVATYTSIQEDWRKLERSLRYRQRAHRNDQDYYYRLRARTPSDPIQRASRVIYLNRTCFNGIYRVNRQGEFNVPRGSKDGVLLGSDNFESIARLLKGADIRVSDFEALVDEAQKGDFLFADPPYTVLHNYNGFVKYNEVLFSWTDQERLAEALTRAKKRGTKIISTNANHVSVRKLYQKAGFKVCTVSRFSRISADNASRRYFQELIILGNV